MPTVGTPEAQRENTHYENKGNQVIVGTYHEAPEFVKDNEYIKLGYRINCDSMFKVIKSLFVIHNESVNVWSHILGAWFTIGLIFYTVISITSLRVQLVTIIEQVKTISESWSVIESAELHSFVRNWVRVTKDFVKNSLGSNQQKNGFWDYINSWNTFLTDVKGVNQGVLKTTYNTIIISIIETVELIQTEVFDLININNDVLILPRWPLFIMLISAVICLSFSASFHWLQTYSKTSFTIFSRWDYAGVTLLIAGSCYPPYYYFFYCVVFKRNFYLIFMSIFSISVFLYSLTSDFHSPERRTLRGSLFLILGLSAGLPLVHLAIFKHSIIGFEITPKWLFWYIGGISYVLGALLFINRIPEKYYPGKFDIFGNSHQIFHCWIVVGVVTHYFGSVDAYYYRYNNKCPK